LHAYGNPHYWLDPANAPTMAANIASGLAAVDPERASAYEQRRRDFEARLERKLGDWETRAAPLEGLHVVAYHNTWPYLARAFGLVVDEFLEPKPGIPPSPAHIARVISAMRANGTKLILVEPWFNRKVPDLVASKTGGRVVQLLPSVGGAEGVATYFDLFDHDLDALLQAARETGARAAR
jgi:ABC-type Zn uptake system ZnuABC Zn-binding protein ZnuA